MRLLNTIKQFCLVLIGLAVVPTYAQQQEHTVESIAFGGYLSPLVKVKKDGRNYLYHPDGDVWIDEVKNYSADLFAVTKDGYYGALRKDGNLIIPFEYDLIELKTEYKGQWHEGIPYDYKFIILTKDGKTGVADENGKIILPLLYDNVKPINRNVIAISEGNYWGWASSQDGKVLQQPKYKYVKDFYSDDFVEIGDEDKIGLAKASGEVIIPVEYDGYLRYVKNDKFVFIQGRKNEKLHLFDTSGNLLLSGHENYGYIADPNYLIFKENDLYGIINPLTRRVIVSNQFYEIRSFVRGIAIAKKAGHFGIIDSNGKPLLNFEYDAIQFISANGNFKYVSIPTITEPELVFTNKKISEEEKKRKEYEAEIESKPYLIEVTKQNKVGVYSWDAKEIIPIGKYNRIQPHYYKGKTFFIVESDNKMGITDENGKEILPVAYEHNGSYQFSKNDVDGQFDVSERFISFSVGNNVDHYLRKIGLFDLELKKVIIEPNEQVIVILNDQLIKIKTQIADYNDEILLYDISQHTSKKLPENVHNIGLLDNQFLLLELKNRMFQLTDLEGNLIYENPNWKSDGMYNHIRFPEYRDHLSGNFYHGLKKIYSGESNLFVDGSGKEKRFEDFDQVDNFYEGFAVAAKKVPDEENYSGFKYKKGFINLKGEVIVPFEYDAVYASGKDSDILMFSRENAHKMIKRDGTVVLGTEFSYIESGSSYDNIIIAKNDKYGLVDSLGTILVEPVYDELRRNYDGEDRTWPLRVKQGEWYYFISKDGKKYPIKARQTHY